MPLLAVISIVGLALLWRDGELLIGVLNTPPWAIIFVSVLIFIVQLYAWLQISPQRSYGQALAKGLAKGESAAMFASYLFLLSLALSLSLAYFYFK